MVVSSFLEVKECGTSGRAEKAGGRTVDGVKVQRSGSFA